MPIEFFCRSCGQKLRVADSDAGKLARCPHCRSTSPVPKSEGTLPQRSFDEPFESPLEQWRMRTEDGVEYGPVDKAELDSWLGEGRITTGCVLRREGTDRWIRAAELYPALALEARSENYAAETSASQLASPPNPYAAPRVTEPVMPPHPYPKPHRGGSVLAAGLIGLLCCNLLGIAAVVMAVQDLREMSSGRMDPGGRGLTIVGLVLGIISILLLIGRVGVRLNVR